MLEPVSLGQGRTHCPGLFADERGVIMGRKLLLFFPDVARTVGFFRSYSREVSLDEILGSLEIRETVSTRGGRELCVSFEVGGSFIADRAAAAARMHRGRVYTASEAHCVPYRDRRAPLGYDLGGPEDVVADPGDLILYGEGHPDRRNFGRTLRIHDLILGLSPRPLSNSERERESHPELVIRCETGLAGSLCRYLWSRQVPATVATASSAKRSLFSEGQKTLRLFRCQQMPSHVAHLLAHTPGMRVFVPHQPHLLVEWGFRHPIALESCGGAFPPEETLLFWGPPHRVERLLSTEEAVDLRDLIDVTVHDDAGALESPLALEATPLESLDVELRLARVPQASAPTTALLIEREKMPWFRKLVYLLPAPVLRTYEAAIAGPYILVINRRGVQGIPFGEPMTEAYPQVFLPVGTQLLPHVDYGLLREHLQIRPDQCLYFFPEGKPPFSIDLQALKPLSRAVVAPERAKASILELLAQSASEPLPDSTVVHKRQAAFSLWRGAKREPHPSGPALPSPSAPATLQLAAPADISDDGNVHAPPEVDDERSDISLPPASPNASLSGKEGE